MKTIKAYVINHGHMDIEWYQPMTTFSEWFAQSLRHLDAIVRADPAYRCYTFDGVVFPVLHAGREFPDTQPILRRLIAEDKLKIGPFYTQFDEFLVGGESIIQNCLWGDRACRELQAKPVKAGYLLDNFGHPAQLPQILRSFEIRSLFFSRGMCDIGDNVKEFVFRSPDGSEVVAQNFSYGTSFKIYENNSPRPATPNFLPYYDEIYSTYDYLTDLSRHLDHKNIAHQLIAGVKNALRFYPSGIVPLFVGADHCPPQEGLSQTLSLANEMQDEIEFIFSDAQALSEALNENKEHLVSYTGDLLGCKFDRLLFGANTTRIYLKQRMYALEHLLFDYTLPLSAYAKQYGADTYARERREATELLLINSTHDSIHGCSLDCVHRENEARFDRAAQLCARTIHGVLEQLSEKLSDQEGKEAFTVFSPRDFHSYLHAWLLTDSKEITVTDGEGKSYPCVTLPQTPITVNAKGEPYYQRPTGEAVREVIFRADLMAGEVKKFYFTPSSRAVEELVPSHSREIQNEHFRLRVENNALHLWDLATHQKLPFFLRFTEEAETGDTFDHSSPWTKSSSYSSDAFLYTDLRSYQCELCEKLETTCTLRVPAETTGDCRSESLVDLPIRLGFTLWKGIRRLDLRITIRNQARNHRVRAEFAFPEAFPEVLAGELFGAEHLAVEREPMTEFWKEPPAKELPLRNWVSVSGERLGYTLCTKGLYAFEPLDHQRLAFTLFRSVGELMRINIQNRSSCCMTGIPVEDAQCLREMSFEFSLFTHEPKIAPHEIERLTEEVICPPAVHPLRYNRGIKTPITSLVPFRFLENRGLVLSAFLPSYDDQSFVLRFYEINGEKTTAKIELSAYSRVFLSDMNENPQEELPLREGIVELEVPPHKIITLLLKK